MANSDDTGQSRVNRMEKNNRRSESARGSMAKTPRQSGAQSGFKSNRQASNKKIAGNRV